MKRFWILQWMILITLCGWWSYELYRMPVAFDKSVLGKEDQPVEFSLKFEDQWFWRDYQVEFLGVPEHGTLTPIKSGFRFVPEPDFHGHDRVSFRLNNRGSYSEIRNVRFAIRSVNDPPVALSEKMEIPHNTAHPIKLRATDADQDYLQFKIIESPKHGQLKGFGPDWTYVPHPGFVGIDTFKFNVSDFQNTSEPEIVELLVEPSPPLSQSQEAVLTDLLQQLITNGGIAIGGGKLSQDRVYGEGEFIPASTLKVATGVAALEQLGDTFRFKTEFYLDTQKNLWVKGYGDPTLNLEVWEGIIAEIRQLPLLSEGVINNLYLDDTVFHETLDFDGRQDTLNYYDAPLGALVTNYNSVSVRIDRKGHAKPIFHHLPVTSQMQERAHKLRRGRHYINIAQDSPQGTLHTGEILRHLLKRVGIDCQGMVERRALSKGSERIYVYESRLSLREVVQKMLKDSNNFIANQLLLTMALHQNTPPVRMDQGVALLRRFLTDVIHLDPAQFVITEGSGLSRNNRITAMGMLKILKYTKTEKELLPLLQLSHFEELAEIGSKWKVLAKSGTLSDVSNLVGYFKLPQKGEWRPFVIFLNQKEANRGAVFDLIASIYAGHSLPQEEAVLQIPEITKPQSEAAF